MAEHAAISNKIVNLIGAIDQGTSSSRFLVFSPETAEIVTYHQIRTKQIYPQAGWVEQDPMEILSCVLICIDKTVEKLREFEIDPSCIKAIGVTNQRETTIVWNKYTGKPLYNAIIWLDARTTETVETLSKQRGARAVRERCGLPITSYFSAVKLRWLIENIPEIKEGIIRGQCLFGTVDSWLIWNLTGGVNNGIHVTDVTNASRTMLMDIRKLHWDPWLCSFFRIPMSILPYIRSSSEILGYLSCSSLSGVPISGCLGDQSSALVGQLCLNPGTAKNTYGTGCFLLCNTGRELVWSQHGLLTTVAYQLGPNAPTIYALEGSVAIAGALIQWLRDNFGFVGDSTHIEALASSVDDTHGVYFVPAFCGLYAPYWEPSARGLICGLTQYSTKAHVALAALESVCFQTCEIVDAMRLDTGFSMKELQVDGGMTSNKMLLQLQSDLLSFPVVLPSMPETTALGVAIAAGAAKGIEVWDIDKTASSDVTTDTFKPRISQRERDKRYAKWKKAVGRSLFWDEDCFRANLNPILQSLPGGIFLFTSFAILLLAEALK